MHGEGVATPGFSFYHEEVQNPIAFSPSFMSLRASVGLGVLAGALLLGLSCSGPSPAPSGETTDPSRVYHVQLDMTKEKETANQILGRALTWWEAHAASVAARPLTAADASPVTVAWRAPLYRVRIGPFASRDQAESVLQTAQSAFPGAFVRPDSMSTQP